MKENWCSYANRKRIFKIDTLTREKEGYYIKGSIHQGYITIISLYAHHNEVPNI